MKIVTIVGARPQFIKAAAVSRAIADHNSAGGDPITEILVHTGQHYDENLSQVFFNELDIPEPAYNLGVGSHSHGIQTGRMLQSIEPVLLTEKPDWVLVYGDTNSTLAGALAARKLGLRTAHVEAGLRSFHPRMAEEINRVLADRISDLLFCPTETAVANLCREGITSGVHQVGDVMYDASLFYRARARHNSHILERLRLERGKFVLATVHRAENTDDPARLGGILDGLARIAEGARVILALHPRTRKLIAQYGFERGCGRVEIIDPVSYLDMVQLEEAAQAICTDSGGVQKEAFFFRVPCITLRDETEWVETVSSGWNCLVGADADRIAPAVTGGKAPADRPQPSFYGDGSAGESHREHPPGFNETMMADREYSPSALERTDVRALTLLGFLALLLYVPAFWWGAPHATAPDRVRSWGVDDETPLGPLAEVHNVFYPPKERNLGYPLMHFFLMATAYSPYLAYLRATGQFVSPTGTYPFGFSDPVAALKVLSWIARFISALMAAGIVVAAFLAARALWDRRTAIFAALFAMTSYPMFYYSRTGNVDVPALFFIALALAVYARILVAGFTFRRAAWLGVFVGSALATKEPSFAAFIGLPFVLVPWHWFACRKSGAVGGGREFVSPLLTALFAAFLAFGLGSGMFIDPGRFFAHLEFARERIQAAASGEIAFVKTFPFTWEGHVSLARRFASLLADSLTLPGLVTACLGLALTLWQTARGFARQHFIPACFAVPAITYLLVLFLSARIAHLRYFMPAAWVLAIFAARGVAMVRESSLPALRPVALVLAGWIIGLGLLRGVDLTYSMLNDSRYAAADWLRSHAKPGMRVEFFGPDQKLPALEPGVVSARAITYLGAIARPRTEPEAVREILDAWNSRRPDFILSIPDHSSPSGYQESATCPPPIYAGLLDGSIGYRLAAQFHTAPLLPWVRRPALDYPSVNPPVRIFVRADSTSPAPPPAASTVQRGTH